MFTKAEKRNILLFTAAFLLLGVLRVLLYAKDFSIGFSLIFNSALSIFWGIAVRKRITDKRLRFLMMGVAAFLLLQFVLQFVRYNLLYRFITPQRYLWYAYYIPMTALPLLLFFIAVCIHRPQDKPLPRRYWLLILIAALLVLGVMTNDLHFAFKSFPSGIMDDNGQEKSGPLYYIISFFSYGLYALAFLIIERKNQRHVARKYRWIAALPLLIGAFYVFLYPLDLGGRLFLTRVWQIGEMMGFSAIALLEACLLTGMIPANRGYEKLFSAARLPAVIKDRRGAPVYRTAAAGLSFAESENTKLISHPIQGGSIEYLVDMTQMWELNRQIEDATRQIETRNAYIAEENRIKQEQSELETKNRLYERVSAMVRPQLEQIDGILNTPEGVGEKALARIAVLKAYIKRRSNMELLAAAGTLPAAELAAAITESLDYVRLCGVNTAAGAVGAGSFPAPMVIAAYEQIEEILEESLESLSDMIVTVRSEKQSLTLRMMLKAENFSYEIKPVPRENGSFSRKVAITKENEDMIIVLSFAEGGGEI